jgi:hypothetical protein
VEEIKLLLEKYPYLTYLVYGGNDYVGIVQNSDEQITTIYDYNLYIICYKFQFEYLIIIFIYFVGVLIFALINYNLSVKYKLYVLLSMLNILYMHLITINVKLINIINSHNITSYLNSSVNNPANPV